MDRRAFISGAAAVLAAPLAAEGQQAGKMPRVGYLNPGSSSDPVRQRRLEALRQGLRELGYVEGQNLALELRWAEGKYDRYPALAADLVRSKVDVIVAWSGQATKAAQEAARTIPIVMSLVNEPVRWRTKLGPCGCGFKFWGCGTRRRSPGYGLAMSPVSACSLLRV